jgi:hypothetical protein
MTCGVRYSDAHKSGNPYVWQKEDCGSPDLCKVDTHLGFRGAFCLIQPGPLAECANSTGYACVGDRGVECTDSHYGANPRPCPSCSAVDSSLSCAQVTNPTGDAATL